MSRWDLHPDRIDRACVLAFHPRFKADDGTPDVLAVLEADAESRGW